MRSRSAERLLLQHTPCAAANSDVPGPEHFERNGCGAHEISDFMREEPQAFVISSGFGIKKQLVAASVFRNGTRDSVVQASVQGPELLHADRRLQLQRQVGDGLTHIPVVVHDLRHGKSLQLEIMAVARSASADLSIRRQVVPQGIDELIEKPGDPELEFGWRRRRNRPHLNLRATAADELFAVLGNKFMKHDRHSFLTFSRRRTDSTTKKPHEQEQPRFDLGGSEPTPSKT